MGTRSFPGVQSGQGVTLTPHPLLLPWSWKGRAILLLPLRPIQSLKCLYKGALYLYLYLYICSTIRIQRGLSYLQYKNSMANGMFQISNIHGKVLWLHPNQHIFYPLPPTVLAAMPLIPSNGSLNMGRKNNAHEHWIINWARLIHHMLMGL